LYSGGKDSTYACYLAREEDSVVCLVTLFPSRSDSYMFHYPNVRWSRLQAEAMRLPQVTAETEGVKERELDDLERALRKAKQEYTIEGVYSGALASEYQKSRVELVCSKLGLKAMSPLWHLDQVAHLRNLVANRFDVMMTAVAALGLGEGWLGRHLDEGAVAELARLHERYGLNAGLEGGEGETFVLDCPIFFRRIEVVSSKKHWEGDRGYLEILDARLSKPGSANS